MRRLLLAVVLCAAAWAAVAQAVTPAADTRLDTLSAGRRAETASASPAGPDDSDRAWVAAERTHISVTESLWKSSVVHAELAGARSGVAGDVTISDRLRDRRDRDGPADLRQIPLRI